MSAGGAVVNSGPMSQSVSNFQTIKDLTHKRVKKSSDDLVAKSGMTSNKLQKRVVVENNAVSQRSISMKPEVEKFRSRSTL